MNPASVIEASVTSLRDIVNHSPWHEQALRHLCAILEAKDELEVLAEINARPVLRVVPRVALSVSVR
jgi:hypothetical protein